MTFKDFIKSKQLCEMAFNIEVFLLNISKDIEKDENNFKQMYPKYLEKIKEF